MAQATPFDPVMTICGMIYRDGGVADAACTELVEAWGPVETLSPAFSFTQTTYYQDEMGKPLFRRFVAFSDLIDPAEFFRLKHKSNDLEQSMALGEKRTINLDPGILSLANLLIATCKNHYHRIPLKEGIYAHLEYVFKNGDFSPLPWTYPDFMTPEYLEFFRNLRLIYKSRLKAGVNIRGLTG